MEYFGAYVLVVSHGWDKKHALRCLFYRNYNGDGLAMDSLTAQPENLNQGVLVLRNNCACGAKAMTYNLSQAAEVLLGDFDGRCR